MIDADAAELELTCSADGALKNIALNGAPLSSGPHGTSGGRKIRAPQGSGLLRRGVNTLSVVVGSAGASPSAVGFYAEGHAVVGVRTKQADWPPTASTRSGETARVATSTDTLAGFHYGVRGTGQPAWLWTTLAEVADREEELADLHASASGDRRGDSILQDLREAEGGLARLQAKITRYVPDTIRDASHHPTGCLPAQRLGLSLSSYPSRCLSSTRHRRSCEPCCPARASGTASRFAKRRRTARGEARRVLSQRMTARSA